MTAYIFAWHLIRLIAELSMTEDDALKDVETLMGKYGVAVERIPSTSTKKQPDFKFEWGAESYVVEMKQRDAKWQFTPEEKAAFADGEVVSRQEGLGYFGSFAKQMKKAGEQLDAYIPGPEDFRLIWYWTEGQFAELAATRIITTLLGDVWVLELDSGRQWRAHFFDENLITKFGDMVDGAVVGEITDEGAVMHLVLNPFSSRYEQLRISNLAEAFKDGVRDSFAMEKAGTVLIVDAAADKTSERATLNYLGDKYSINVPQILRIGHMAAVARGEP